MRCAFLLLVFSFAAAAQDAEITVDETGFLVQTESKEVVLDLIVRDGRGRPVVDLSAEEIEVLEAGAPQEIVSFRLVQGSVTGRGAAGNVAETDGGVADRADASVVSEPSLVTFVFERLGTEARRLAANAALDFLKEEMQPNVYASVFALNQRLEVLQPFTTDASALRRAVRRAGGQASATFAAHTEKAELDLRASLEELQQRSNEINPVALKVAQITYSMLEAGDRIDQLQRSSSVITGLTGVIEGQADLRGRKTVVYFSEGMPLPADQIDRFRSLLSAANKAQVTFYAVDARGLQTVSDLDRSRRLLATAASASQAGQRDNIISPDQMRAIDTARESVTARQQGNLAALAASTGGFLVANTNDFREPLRRISEEIGTYYEISYRPPPMLLDGSFRDIEVQVARRGADVRTRDGYYAVPDTGGIAVLPYEAALLAALQARPLPAEFAYRSVVQQFPTATDKTQASLLVEVPLGELELARDPKTSGYHAEVAVLAQLKNAAGEIVRKESQRLPLDGSAEELPALEAGHFTFYRNWDLEPGRYVLETAVKDSVGNALGAKRAYALVQARAGAVAMSSVSLIRNIEPSAVEAATATNDPFRVPSGRIIPSLDETVRKVPEAQAGFYFVVYPGAGTAARPTLSMDFLREGKLIAHAAPELPEADEAGAIPYIAMTPVETFEPGRYEVITTVKQGDEQAQERAFFTVVP